MDRIILASGSPRRKQLLEWAEVDFEIIVRDTPETYPAGMAVIDVPVHIARNKALAVQAVAQPGQIVIAADTVVVLGDEIIGKPRDRDDAVAILSRLSGKRHEVITGVVLLEAGGAEAGHAPEAEGRGRSGGEGRSGLAGERSGGDERGRIDGLGRSGGREQAFADVTSVWFHELSRAELEGYVDRYKPYDKAGAYAIQEWIGVVGIQKIEGDFYNVMGLPVSRVVQALKKWRAIP
jgi:septum formation protein